MKYRRLGNSGLLVSELALGTMVFGEQSGRGTNEADALRMVDMFLDAGGNHVDLANVYAGGRAEEIVGQALKGKRGRALLATKVRWPMGGGPNEAGLSRHHILESVEASLRRLGTEHIDVLYMHGWDAWTPLEELLRAFEHIVASGKARYIGVSNFKAWQVMKALGLSDRHGWARFVAAQYQYSLVMRDIEAEFADLCLAEGVGLVPWGPLGGGFLSGKYGAGGHPAAEAGRIGATPAEWEESWERRSTDRNWRTLEVVSKVAAGHAGATPAQVAIAWLLAQPSVSSVVVGARTPDQLETNLAAASLSLADAEVRALTTASAAELPYPARAVNPEFR